MKKLLLFSALFFTMGTTFATVQDDVAAVLAKTKYKNIMTFLGDVSKHPEYCANGIVYEDGNTVDVSFAYDVLDMVMEKNENTIQLCREHAGICFWSNIHDYDDCLADTVYITDGILSITMSNQNFIYYNDSLIVMDMIRGVTFLDFPQNKDNELNLIYLVYCNDGKVHIAVKKIIVKSTDTAQDVKVKYELIDNDPNGRAALTNLTIGDSATYYTSDNYERKRLTKYVYFDTLPDIIFIHNYNQGCESYESFYKHDATEMPRIHDTIIVKDTVTVTDTIVQTIKDSVTVKDTIYITKTDTIYITKTDTVYIEKEPNKTAIINKQTNLNIWPNPTKTFVNAEAEEPFSYTLLNNAGVILRKEEGEPSYTISMEKYPDGVYFIKTSDGVIRKIVKK